MRLLPVRPLGSLRLRLLASTLVWVLASIAIAAWGLSGLFHQHLTQQLRSELEIHLEQLSAHLTVDDEADPMLRAQLNDPRLQRPYSGLYWQLDQLDDQGRTSSRGVLRSRSLWDGLLEVPDDALADGVLHHHRLLGPDGALVEVIERLVYPVEAPQQRLRLIVAADAGLISAPLERFNGLLAWSLGILGLGLVVAAIVQVVIGLRPLGDLRQALARLREGGSQRIEGRFPLEVQPLVDEFNAVLSHNDRILGHARTQAGNLAHALKTPLSILANAALDPDPRLPQLVREQVALAQRQVDHHLARARAAAAVSQPGMRCQLRPQIDALVRVMERLHGDKPLHHTISGADEALAFRGEKQDLQEMLGNLLDNAWKWAAHRVAISCHREGSQLIIWVDDDGPGLAPERREAVLARGVRADERVPGSGLGLAIVTDLAQVYQGSISLQTSPLGGLRASLRLPAAREISR